MANAKHSSLINEDNQSVIPMSAYMSTMRKSKRKFPPVMSPQCIRIYVFVAILLFFFVTHPLLVLAEEKSNSNGPAELKGDKVEYINTENKFSAEGNVVVTRGDTKLYADELDFYRQEKIGMAQGNVVLESPKGTITGDKMTYNFQNQTGNFNNAGVFADPYYGKGLIVSKTGPNNITLQDGYITTSDFDEPEYKIKAETIDIEPGKQVVARNVKLYVGPVPLMYLPKYTQSLVDRRSRVTLTPGYTKNFGFFLLQGWRYEFNRKVKGTLHFDYRERKDFASGVDVDYKTDTMGSGAVKTYYMNERNITSKHVWQEKPTPTVERERFKVQWRHQWQPDPTLGMIWQYYKLSDAGFLKDYFEHEHENDSSPQTYFVLTKTLPKGIFSFRLDKRVNRFSSQVERLPELNYTLSNQQIGTTGLYLKSNSTISNLSKKEASPTEVNAQTQRIDTQNEVSYPFKVAFIEFKPFIGGQNTYYSRTKFREDYNSIRGALRTGSDMSTKFSRVYDVDGKFLGVQVHRLRHIVTPSIAYLYLHEPTIPASSLDQYDSIDALDNSHKFGLSLENKWQTKRNGKVADLLRIIGGSDFLLKDDPGKGGFNAITSDVEFTPNDWLTFASDTEYDPIAEHLKTANFDMYLKDDKRGWYFDLGKRYSRGVDDQITTELGYKLNPFWSIKVYERFDIDGGLLKEQQYSLTRDLHSWEMDMNFNQTRGDGSEVWLIFRLKAFPDMGFDFGSSFNRRKAGAQTGSSSL